jgi:hypothetical protein
MINLAIFAADLHLCQRTRSSFPNMLGDSYFGLRQLIDLANQYKLPLVLAGDIFDKAMVDSQTLHVYINELSRLQPGLHVYAIEGDHELANPKWFTFSDRAVALAGQSVKLDCDVWLRGIDFQRADTLPVKLLEARTVFDTVESLRNTILVTHEGWAEMRGLGLTEGKFSDISGFTTVVSGDFHVHGCWQGQNAENLPLKVYSPGSTCMQSVSESPDKFALLCAWSPETGISFQQIPLRTRPFFQLHIADTIEIKHALDDLAKIVENAKTADLPVEIKTPFVQLETQVDLNSVNTELRQLSKILHLNITRRVPQTLIEEKNVTSIRIDAHADMASAVRRRAATPAVCDDALSLWRADAPATVIDAIKQRILNNADN